MINNMISAFSNFQHAQIRHSASIAATEKGLDAIEMQGEAALELINSAPKIASTAEIDGKGSFLDMMG